MNSRRSFRGLLVSAVAVLGAALVACRGGQKGASGGPASSASQHVAPEAPKQVLLELLVAHVGDQIRANRKSHMKLAIEFWQEGQKIGTNESTRSEEYTRTADVLSLVGRAPAKIRVRYEQYHLIEIQPDKAPVDQSPLAGHAYLIDAAEGAIRVSGDHGQAVSSSEKDTLEKLHGDLGQEDPIVTALGTRPIPIGQSVPMREPLFRALVNTGTGEFKAGTIVLSGTRPEGGKSTAIFDWSAEMKSQEDNGLEITWHLKGQAILSVAPALTLRATVDGALDVTGHTVEHGAKVDIVGDGSFKDERIVSPP